MKFSKLLAAYKALDVKYNKLVDKYKLDMANALDRLDKTHQELRTEREKVRQLISTKGDLESKIAFLGSEVCSLLAWRLAGVTVAGVAG